MHIHITLGKVSGPNPPPKGNRARQVTCALPRRHVNARARPASTSPRVLRAGSRIVGDDGGRGATLNYLCFYLTVINRWHASFNSPLCSSVSMGNEASQEGGGQPGQPAPTPTRTGAPASGSAPPGSGQQVKPSNGAPAGVRAAGGGPGVKR